MSPLSPASRGISLARRRPRRTSPVSRVVSHVPRSLVSESVSRCGLWPAASGVAAFAGLAVEATALPIYLRLIVTASAVQLDPAHEADARFFKGDRGCWKAWLRSARLTNACGRRPSAPLRKVIESPVQHGGQPGRRMFLRHILIMRLLATASVSGLLRDSAHLR